MSHVATLCACSWRGVLRTRAIFTLDVAFYGAQVCFTKLTTRVQNITGSTVLPLLWYISEDGAVPTGVVCGLVKIRRWTFSLGHLCLEVEVEIGSRGRNLQGAVLIPSHSCIVLVKPSY